MEHQTISIFDTQPSSNAAPDWLLPRTAMVSQSRGVTSPECISPPDCGYVSSMEPTNHAVSQILGDLNFSQGSDLAEHHAHDLR